MTDISLGRAQSKASLVYSRQDAQGQTDASNRPRIKVGLLDNAGSLIATLIFDGRDAWALDQLIKAGTRGCTPIDNPAPRWSHYIWKLRQAGVIIETHDEPHGGPYAGHHARYELRSKLVVLENTFSREDVQ